MPRVVNLPERLFGAVIHGCYECPFFDGGGFRNEHCNCSSHYGIEGVGPVEDGFEIGCPLEHIDEGVMDARSRTGSLE
jgi:hypothetical protein